MSKLVVLRGPSGAGKSTVARLLRTHVSTKTALFEQDYFRHTMFNGPHTDIEAPRQVMFAGMAAALVNGYDVIAEGILSIMKYKPYFDELLNVHHEENYFFYFDISFEETVRRHATRDKRDHFDVDVMREWFERSGPTGYINEYRIPEAMSAEEAFHYICGTANLALSDELPSTG